MKATKRYVEQKFEEFNRLCFNGQLPKLPIELSDAKTFLGVCVYKKRKTADGKVEPYDFRLRINTRIDLPEEIVEDTIIHEMIHYFIGVNKLEDVSSHGPVFRHIMNSINERYGRHIKVSHKSTEEQTEQSYDTKQHWHVVAVVSFKNGKTGLKVLPRVLPRIINYNEKIGNSPQVEDIKFFMSDDIYFNRFPNSSALNARYVDKDEVMGHLGKAEKLRVEGDKVIRNA
jgi:predicted SprT family Zn-dependent metalloprotease